MQKKTCILLCSVIRNFVFKIVPWLDQRKTSKQMLVSHRFKQCWEDVLKQVSCQNMKFRTLLLFDSKSKTLPQKYLKPVLKCRKNRSLLPRNGKGKGPGGYLCLLQIGQQYNVNSPRTTATSRLVGTEFRQSKFCTTCSIIA